MRRKSGAGLEQMTEMVLAHPCVGGKLAQTHVLAKVLPDKVDCSAQQMLRHRVSRLLQRDDFSRVMRPQMCRQRGSERFKIQTPAREARLDFDFRCAHQMVQL